MENASNTKTCPKCGRTLTIDNFYQRGDGRLYTYCKECVKANNRKYRNTPPRFGKPAVGIHSPAAHAGTCPQRIHG